MYRDCAFSSWTHYTSILQLDMQYYRRCPGKAVTTATWHTKNTKSNNKQTTTDRTEDTDQKQRQRPQSKHEKSHATNSYNVTQITTNIRSTALEPSVLNLQGCQIFYLFKKKGKRKVQGVPRSQTAALPRPQEEEENTKTILNPLNPSFI